MKVKFRIFTVILAIFIISPFYLTFVGAEEELYNEEITQPCPHNTLYNFDEKNKTLNGVYEGNRVEALLSDIAFVGDEAVVLYNGKTITEGELQIGMLVQIYHNDTLFGEYVIQELLEPFPEVLVPVQENVSSSISTQTNVSTLSAGNAYGFILPLDGMNLTTHVSAEFGSNYGGPNYSYSNHRGTDFRWDGINGTPIRAVKAGTVDATNIDWTYGNHVRIDHGNGQKTLYAHMKYTPLVSSGENVAQGQIIGYVGNTGNVYPAPTESNPTAGTHLHFEVIVNGAFKNPITYLTGAPTYSSNTFTIKYYPNGGSGTMADTVVPYGVSTPTRTNAFTYPGHVFTGWHVANFSTGTWRYYNPSNPSQTGWYAQGSQPSGWEKLLYENGESVGWTVEPGQVAAFYAVWTYGFTVKYDPNGGSGTMVDTVVPYGVLTPTRLNTFTCADRVFTGWYVKNNSTGKWRYYNPNNTSETGWYTEGSQPSGWQLLIYENGESVGWTAEPGETVTFYAAWTYGFTVKYDPNGGTGTMADTVVPYGVSTPTRLNTFTRTGYVFAGWYVKYVSGNTWRYYNPNNTDETGWYTEGSQPSGWQKMVYENGEALAWTTYPGETLIFYAVWEEI